AGLAKTLSDLPGILTSRLAVSTGSGVNSFTSDPSLGNFILTPINIRIPKTKINSVNEGTTRNWDEPIANMSEKCKFPLDDSSPKSFRFIGRYI
ncbi:hypothetical protein TorRG33x02_135550, partial [Trema orientale]